MAIGGIKGYTCALKDNKDTLKGIKSQIATKMHKGMSLKCGRVHY